MQPIEELQDYFDFISVKKKRKQLDQLLRIALVTDNQQFSEPEDRLKLYEFKVGLMDCLKAAPK